MTYWGVGVSSKRKGRLKQISCYRAEDETVGIGSLEHSTYLLLWEGLPLVYRGVSARVRVLHKAMSGGKKVRRDPLDMGAVVREACHAVLLQSLG